MLFTRKIIRYDRFAARSDGPDEVKKDYGEYRWIIRRKSYTSQTTGTMMD